MNIPYSNSFFAGQLSSTRSSAETIAKVAIDILTPKSVVDVGCGAGVWLAEFQRQGIADILGIDGDYVNREMLQIPTHNFRPHDLTKPLKFGRKFDLSVSLEVAEHLPAESAEQFVGLLTSLAPAVLFSAAIPGQGGVNHVNEQWQSYWANLFNQRGYVTLDCVRPQIWGDPKVLSYYAQNIVLYVERDRLDSLPDLGAYRPVDGSALFDVVHPGTFRGLLNCTHPDNIPTGAAAGQLARSISNALGRRLRRFYKKTATVKTK